MTRVIGFDPGRSKCGLVLVRTDAAQVLDSDVLVPEAVLNTLDQWSQGGNLPMIVMGDGADDTWKTPLKLTTVVQVNERNSRKHDNRTALATQRPVKTRTQGLRVHRELDTVQLL